MPIYEGIETDDERDSCILTWLKERGFQALIPRQAYPQIVALFTELEKTQEQLHNINKL